MIATYLLDWLNLLLRWGHVMVGITWIGTSFFFIWLNQSLKNVENQTQNALPPSIWAIHGGGLFQFSAYTEMPAQFPKNLRWFKWEAYATWLSGMCLLLLLYYVQGEVYLLDKDRFDLSLWQAAGIGLATIMLAWFIYDFICHTALTSNTIAFVSVMLAIIALLSYGLTTVFSGRGAYLHIGAIIGTLMAGNVYRVIIPAQQAMLAQIKQGGQWSSDYLAHSRLRSTHNNYMTLPVLFFMLSNHYPALYNHRYNWIILIALILIGACVRHYFNQKHSGNKQPQILVIAFVALLFLAVMTTLTTPAQKGISGSAKTESELAVTASKVVAIIELRCNSCHSSFTTANYRQQAAKGINFDSPVNIQKYAPQIKRVVVNSDIMPPENTTGMTPVERRVLASWIAQGAKLER